MNTRTMRFLLAAVMAALMMLTMAEALAATEFDAVVTASKMKIYRETEPHDQIGELPKGTVVTVKDYSGKAALIAYKGFTGIARVSDMKAAGSKASKSAEKAEKIENDSSSALSSTRVMITTRKAKVYKKASTSSDSATVQAGVKVNVLAISGGVAKVERGGKVGYMSADCLGEVEAQAEKTASAEVETVEASTEEKVIQYDDREVMTARSCRIYAQPSASGESVSLDKGVALKLVATKGDWAMVKRDGVVGYTDRDNLTAQVSTAEIKPETESTAKSKEEDIFTGTNQQIIYKFLTRVMGYNTAAACGVMSNMKYESDYKPTTGGDHGTSYGLTQWHAERKDEMIEWCNRHGYDPNGVKGQLYFLQYELKTYYPAIHSRLKSIENTAQGAYDAAYDFCYKYEIPTNRASRSVTRANYARDTLYPQYKA